ncbi:MAG: hypothetical protein HY824_15920 [Acidobacteria bacterium]|nr:hypothetical protein [Acidobacteriota bacterium]
MSSGTSKSSSRDRYAPPERLVWLLACAAPALVGLFALLLGIGTPAVVEWFWPAPATNIAEAAAVKDSARVRDLDFHGASLNAVLPVRPALLDRAPAEMTPLEAAVRSGDDGVVGVVLELGARPSLDEVRRLLCLATAIDLPRTAALLQRIFSLDAPSCGDPARQ